MKPAIGDLVKYVNASIGDEWGPSNKGISPGHAQHLRKEFIVTGHFEHGVYLKDENRKISAFFWRVEPVIISLENE